MNLPSVRDVNEWLAATDNDHQDKRKKEWLHQFAALIPEYEAAMKRVAELEAQVASLQIDTTSAVRVIVDLKEQVTSIEEATIERCAIEACLTYENASNSRPEYLQNKLSHGCIYSCRAIRALPRLAGKGQS